MFPRDGGPVFPYQSRRIVHVFSVCLVAACGWSLAAAAPPDKASVLSAELCLNCHVYPVPSSSGVRPTVRAVEKDELAASVHASLNCVQCHVTIRSLDHGPNVVDVNCRRCHSVVQAAPPDSRDSPAVPPGAHWQALVMGRAEGPTCKDCHGSHGVLRPENPQSSVHREMVPKTCGRCHTEEYGDYRESVHGVALAQGNADVPVCSDCHGEHPPVGRDEPDSPVSPKHVPETCSKCHEPLGLEHRYNLPPVRYETYRRSYHGIANWFGNVVVAQCASCHGAHDIRPASDPKSSISKRNLPRTCGKCHPGTGANIARGSIHVMISKAGEPVLYHVSTAFRLLTILVMSGLVGHIMLDLAARWRERSRSKE